MWLLTLALHHAPSPFFWPVVISFGSSAKMASIVLEGPSRSPQTSPGMTQLTQLLFLRQRSGGTRPQHNIPKLSQQHSPCLVVSTRGMSTAPEGSGEEGQGTAVGGTLSHRTPSWAALPGPRGRAHRAGADAAGVLAAVPVPAVGTAVDGLADVAVPSVAGGAGAGHVHAGLGALCVPGTAPVVLAAHVDHCRRKVLG